MNTLYYAKVKEVLEYEYDFTSRGALYAQFENLGFTHRGTAPAPRKINFGFTKILSLFGAEANDKFYDSRYIELAFKEWSLSVSGKKFSEARLNYEEYTLPEKDRDSIRNFLRRQYGEPESVLLPEPDLPFFISPVEKPHLPIMRWELEDRYLYFNDYPDIDMFEIRIQMK